MTSSHLIAERLAVLGVARPSTQLIARLDADLEPRLRRLVAKAVTVRAVARAFAATLGAPTLGSPEGSNAPLLASSELEPEETIHVAGATTTDLQ